MKSCTHLDQIRQVTPHTHGCEECLKTGDHLGAPAASSEASLYSKDHVFVVGGGNSAGQAVMHFARYAPKVTMVVAPV